MERTRVTGQVIAWYAAHARDLPWRRADVSPWGVLVSEVMLQQTPVARVVGPWREWLDRWPEPVRLAADSPAEAIRAWGRLGYPRRALRLHQAAGVITDRHDGAIPSELAALRALPGVGEYTAAAVLAFAFGRRAVVLDTNVRRVLARLATGVATPAPAITAAERTVAAEWLPEGDAEAARWSVAAMELGAAVCTASAPACGTCPVQRDCRWVSLGRPEPPVEGRRRQPYAGTDRQCRGVLLAELRRRDRVGREELLALWRADRPQAERALASLLMDGLVQGHADGDYTLALGRTAPPERLP